MSFGMAGWLWRFFPFARADLYPNLHREGDTLDWSWLVPPYKWRFDVTATVQTGFIALDGKCLRSKCEKNHRLGFKMMQIFTEIMAERLDATRLQLLNIYGK